MALTRHKLGDLIDVVDERNEFNLSDFYGININKAFMPTAANTRNLDPGKYKVVRKNRFVFSGMQTGRDKNIRISLYQGDEPIIVSPAYTTFEITALNNAAPEYFFMLFLSKEMDRYGWFLSDTSIRSNLDWSVFCDIDIDLPPLEVQQKYVAIYNAMVANQKAYEHGLTDLQAAAESLLERFKNGVRRMPLGELISEVDTRNTGSIFSEVQGVKKEKVFMPSVSTGANLRKYKLVGRHQFACNLMHVGRDVAVPLAMNTGEEPLVVSPAYFTFEVASREVIPEYLHAWMSRAETDRYAWFISETSVRSGMEKSRFKEIYIPVPNLQEQATLVEIARASAERRDINERLQAKIKDICPILIKGSLEEGARHD